MRLSSFGPLGRGAKRLRGAHATLARGEIRQPHGGAQGAGRSCSAVAFVLVLATGIGTLRLGRAMAGVVTQPERVSVSVRGLSTNVRRALAIRSVTAVGDQSLGLIVTVTFKGDVERYLGQGGLANGLLGSGARAIRPKPGANRAGRRGRWLCARTGADCAAKAR